MSTESRHNPLPFNLSSMAEMHSFNSLSSVLIGSSSSPDSSYASMFTNRSNFLYALPTHPHTRNQQHALLYSHVSSSLHNAIQHEKCERVCRERKGGEREAWRWELRAKGESTERMGTGREEEGKMPWVAACNENSNTFFSSKKTQVSRGAIIFCVIILFLARFSFCREREGGGGVTHR